MDLFGHKVRCDGQAVIKGLLNKGTELTIKDCAAACMGLTSMFSFGTNDFGQSKCNATKCNCLCETSSTTDGNCSTTDTDGYRLYTYQNPDLGNCSHIFFGF